MNPVAFEIFGLQIRWYGIIIAGGVLAAFLLSSVLAKKKGVSFDDIVDAFIWAFPIAIVGARAYYVAFEFKNFDSFADMINIRTGGLAIHGGLIAGILTAYIVLKIKKVNFWEYIDVVIPAVVLAQGIGRWGNFMNQEAHGGAVSADFIFIFSYYVTAAIVIYALSLHAALPTSRRPPAPSRGLTFGGEVSVPSPPPRRPPALSRGLTFGGEDSCPAPTQASQFLVTVPVVQMICSVLALLFRTSTYCYTLLCIWRFLRFS